MAWRNKIREVMATASEGDIVEVKLTPSDFAEIFVFNYDTDGIDKVNKFMKKNYGFAPVTYKFNTDYINCKYSMEFAIPHY